MELIIFASLCQAKKGVIFNVHFYSRTFNLRGAAEVVLSSSDMNKASTAKNPEVPADFLEIYVWH